MSEFKGTPRPWFAVEFAGYWAIADEPFYEAKNLLDAEQVGVEISKANAVLAAAAPELLEILQEMVDNLPTISPYHQDLKVKAIELINKATSRHRKKSLRR